MLNTWWAFDTYQCELLDQQKTNWAVEFHQLTLGNFPYTASCITATSGWEFLYY